MNVEKKAFINQLRERYGYTKKDATDIVNDFIDTVLDNLEQGNCVNFYGFGCFDMVERKERLVINPQTGERCPIPTHWVPRFYPGNAMRRAVKLWEDNGKGVPG